MSRNIQVGIIGSMLDTDVKSEAKILATKLGNLIAEENITLLFGYEGDFESLPFLVAKKVSEKGGKCIAFLREKITELESIKNMAWIKTGQQRGGGREFPFILSCDVVVAIGGGSGTLMEISMAYQADIPIIAFRNSGGWSEKLADKFLDDRKRLKIVGVDNPEEVMGAINNLT